MTTPTHILCPHCSATLPKAVSFSGSPILTCPHCGGEYFDKDIREPGFYEPPKHSKAWFLNWGFELLFIVIVWFAASIGTLRLGASKFSWWPLVFPVPVILWGIPTFFAFRGENKEYKINRQEYKASVQRMSDKAHIKKLLDYGYAVPASYLRAYYPDLATYAPKEEPQTKDGTIFYF